MKIKRCIKVINQKICDKQHQPPLVVNYMHMTCLQQVSGTSKTNVSDANTRLFRGSKHCSRELSRVKLHKNDLRGNNCKNYFELAGGSSYRRFELPRVKLRKCMTEIQAKSIGSS